MPLHPQAEAFVASLAEQNLPGWDALSVQEARQRFATFEPFFGEGPPLSRVEDDVLSNGVSVRLYSNRSDLAPVVLYFHGGGWVLGSVATHDAVCRRLALHSGCTVVSVDYRRSPEHPFPGPIDDCYKAIEEVADRAEAWNIDPTRIVVAGDSAGGQLAAAVTLRSRQEGGPFVSLQVLIYPVIEPEFSTESYNRFASGYGLTRAGMQWFWGHFLGSQEVTPLASPIRADSLAGLPPAVIVTAEYDVLRDEGEAYADRLRQHGVDVELERYDGMLHGFVHFAGLFDRGVEATEWIGRTIRRRMALQ
ncbi:alpha/beta hydrolase [Roseiconus nitratireducens]|uniref:Alpha/beta hydrolase n=1 Tax=Roseiconus nitratireducens TaxID=2605748 RepID=A0A5M6D5F8_9BACT|nr:alpha/beta hydrolase [Roseiconus nitratireducens]KAA5542721.1 alpha/beta hydrolase [Roseiconus nitratireducens]